MELWFAQYHISAGEKHLQGTQVKDCKDRKTQVLFLAVANALVLVNDKHKYQSTGRFKTATQETYRYSDIYLNITDVLNDSCLCIDLKKILVSDIFFKFNNYFFSNSTATTNKLDDGILVTHF